MKRKEYEAKRKQLMDGAQQLINDGKGKEAQDKMNEVKKLDEAWDVIAQAEANFKALNNEPKPLSPMSVDDAFDGEAKDGDDESAVVKAWESESYETAWAKTMMGRNLTAEETEKYRLVNEAYTHNTNNTSIVIPKNVSQGIWELVGESYPYFADVTKTYVNGVLSIIQEDTSSDSKWYDEATKTEDGEEKFKEFKLSGCELSRAITVTWKLKEMAIEDFIPYIQRKMARKMGAAAGYGVTHGAGASAAPGKPEPMGVVTALAAEESKSQVVEYDSTKGITYADILSARSKVKAGYGAGLAIYANSSTVWNQLAAVVDGNKRPLFVPDPTSSGVFRILGMVVKEDDSMGDGEVLMSNAGQGYHLNINKEMSMMTEEHVKERNTDYCGYAIMDGNILTGKAHALLTKKATTVE